QNFYRQYYQPDNAVLVVAGKFDANKTLAQISKRFGSIAKPKRILPQAWTVEPTQDGERSVVVRRVGSTQIVAVGYKIPAALHDDGDALIAAGDMLAGSANARLHKLLVESGKAAQVFSYSKNGIDPGLILIAAVVKQGDAIEPVQAAIIDAMENFQAPSAEELERYQRRMALRYEELLNDPASTAQALSEASAQGDWRLLFKGRDDLQKLTLAKISAASKKYFLRDNRIVASFIPDDKPQRVEIPAAPSVAQALADYKPRLAQKAAEEFDPSQANIDARTQRSKIGGVKIALLPKSSRGDQVVVEMQLHYGDAENTKGKLWAATFARAMLTKGTSKFNRQQLADEMDKVKLSGSPSNFQTTKENLVAALDLACHVMREPTFPESEFVQMKQQFKVALAQKKTDPQSLATNALQEYFNPWPAEDMRAYMSIDQQLASLEKLTLAEVKDFYQQFHGASHGEVAIVGAFDVAQAKDALQRCFANWPSKANYVRLDDKNKAVAATRQIIPAPDKENAVYMARVNLDLGRDDDDFALMMLADHMFGGSGMSSRLGERARQKDGLSYGIGSQIHAGEFDRAGSLSISAIVAPQNVTKLEAAIKEELQKTLQNGFSASELAQAKSGLLQQRRLARTEDGALASGLNSLS
ncbi:MAG: insulinase family protein, partial [Burkholderiales bacterium]|nr:insulinase family protein [Burkholderiales bacterium]